MAKKIKDRIKTEYGTQSIILEPDDKGYIVTAPDLEGVVTWGKNRKHAKEMAKEAIELCVECLVEENMHRSKNARKNHKTISL